MATSSVNSIQSSRISWQFLLLTGSICPICSGCFPLVSVVSPLVLLWCVFWVPSGPGANCLVSHLTVSCSTCITTFLTVICASPCLYPDMFNAWRIEKDCTIDYPAQRWIFLLRGRSHITSAAGGGRGVSQMLTIADKGGSLSSPSSPRVWKLKVCKTNIVLLLLGSNKQKIMLYLCLIGILGVLSRSLIFCKLCVFGAKFCGQIRICAI